MNLLVEPPKMDSDQKIKKILFLADANAIHTKRWVKWFSDNNYEVHLASLNEKRLDGYGKIPITNLWSYKFDNNIFERFLKLPFIFYRLKKLIKTFKPDVVHAHSLGGYSFIGAITAPHKLVVTPWGSDINYHMKNSKVYALMGNYSLKTAQMVTTDADFLVPELQSIGIRTDKIVTHSFGTDTKIFSPSKKGHYKKTNTINIISSRTLHPVHDVVTFVEAMPFVLEKHPDVRFTILADGSEMQKISDRCKDLGIEDLVHFPGFLDEHEIADHFKNADIYVSTSVNDAGLASSTAEAMASSLPVVHTNVSDNEKWVSDNDGGFCFAPGDYKTLAKQICKLIDCQTLRENFGQRNRDIIVDYYNLDTEMGKIADVYRRL